MAYVAAKPSDDPVEPGEREVCRKGVSDCRRTREKRCAVATALIVSVSFLARVGGGGGRARVASHMVIKRGASCCYGRVSRRRRLASTPFRGCAELSSFFVVVLFLAAR